MMIPCDRRVVGCDVDTECIEISIFPLVLVFARQVLNPASDIHVSDTVEESCKLERDGEDRNIYRLHRKQWLPVRGKPFTQRLPTYVLQFLSSYHSDYRLYKRCAPRGPDKWAD